MFKAGSIDKLISKLFSDYVDDNNAFPTVVGRDGMCPVGEFNSISDIMNEVNGYQSEWEEKLNLPVVEKQTNIYFHDQGSASTYSRQGHYYHVSYIQDHVVPYCLIKHFPAQFHFRSLALHHHKRHGTTVIYDYISP